MNSYVLFREVRRIRNVIAQLYRCNVEKDEVFYKALLKVEEDMVNLRVNLLNVFITLMQTPEGNRCCKKHYTEEAEGDDHRVAYSVSCFSLRETFNFIGVLRRLRRCYRI